MSERQLSQKAGVPQRTIHDRRRKAIMRLKEAFLGREACAFHEIIPALSMPEARGLDKIRRQRKLPPEIWG